MSTTITHKAHMYKLLARGALGNTTPQYFSVEEWEASPEYDKYEWWGVRTLTPGGPCRLNCPKGEIAATARSQEFSAHGVNISCMLDRIRTVTLWGEVCELPSGLTAYGIEYPPKNGSWRALMPFQGKTWEGTAARLLLRRHLNENSYDDLCDLLDKWPGHVVEFSAVDGMFGTMPGRNAIIWEVRQY
jgi:hypothetical protein